MTVRTVNNNGTRYKSTGQYVVRHRPLVSLEFCPAPDRKQRAASRCVSPQGRTSGPCADGDKKSNASEPAFARASGNG
jgi:hypothetical protein